MQKLKRILFGLSAIAPLLFGSGVYAVTSPTPTTASNPSDYAKDVQEGQNQLKTDADAKNAADQVNQDETDTAEINDSEVPVDETVGPQEDHIDDGQGVSSENEEDSLTNSSSSLQSSPGNSSTDKSGGSL